MRLTCSFGHFGHLKRPEFPLHDFHYDWIGGAEGSAVHRRIHITNIYSKCDGQKKVKTDKCWWLLSR